MVSVAGRAPEDFCTKGMRMEGYGSESISMEPVWFSELRGFTAARMDAPSAVAAGTPGSTGRSDIEFAGAVTGSTWIAAAGAGVTGRRFAGGRIFVLGGAARGICDTGA